MLEKVVSDLLGKYLEDVRHESVKISFREGKCELRNCTLKEEVLTKLGLPFEVYQASFGSLEIRLDWSWAKFSSTASVHLEGVRICGRPFAESSEFSLRKARDALLARKRFQLEALVQRYAQELLASASIVEEQDGWAHRFLAKLIKSAKVSVSNVSCVFQDPFAIAESSICGVVLHATSLTFQDDLSPPDAFVDTSNMVRKVFSVEDLAVTVEEDPQYPTETNILQPFYLHLQVAFNPDSMAAQVSATCGPVEISQVSPDIVHGIFSLLSSWVFFEQWVNKKAHPAPVSARARWRWALLQIRQQLRKDATWSVVSDITKRKYLNALSVADPNNWLDRFETACPLHLLAEWRRELVRLNFQSKHSQQLQNNLQMTPRWKQWLVYVAAQERQEVRQANTDAVHENVDVQDISQSDADGEEQEEQEEEQTAIRTLRLSVPQVQVSFSDDHGFQICQLQFSISCVFIDTQQAQRLLFNLNSIGISHQAGIDENGEFEAASILRVRKTLNQRFQPEQNIHGRQTRQHMKVDMQDQGGGDGAGDDTDIFYDAENGSDIFSRSETLLSTDAPFRFRVDAKQGRATAISLVVEPVELSWDPEILSRVLHFVQNLSRVSSLWLAPLPSSVGRHSSQLQDQLPVLDVRFGAPSVAFFDPCSRNSPTCIIDFGHFTLQRTQAANEAAAFAFGLHGVQFIVRQQKGHFPFHFGSQILEAQCALGPIDVNGAFAFPKNEHQSIALGEINVMESPLRASVAVVLSRTTFRALKCVYLAITKTTTSLKALHNLSSRQFIATRQSLGQIEDDGDSLERRERLPSQTAMLELRVQVPSIKVLFHDKEDLLHVTLNDIECSLSFTKQGSPFRRRVTVGALHSSTCASENQDKTLLHCPFFSCEETVANSWTVQISSRVSLVWVPTLMARIAEHIFEFSASEEQLQNMSIMLQSHVVGKMGGVRHSDSHIQITVRMEGLDIDLEKECARFCSLNITSLEATVQTSLPAAWNATASVQDISVFDHKSVAQRPSKLFGAQHHGGVTGEPLLLGSIYWSRQARHHSRTSLSIQTQDLEFVVWQPYIVELVDYFSSAVLDILAYTARTSLSSGTQSLQSEKQVDLNLHTGTISVQFPVLASHARPCLSLRLLGISVLDEKPSLVEFLGLKLIALLADASKPSVEILDLPSVPLIRSSDTEGGTRLALSDISARLCRASLSIIIRCLEQNLLSNTTLFDAVLLHQMQQEETQGQESKRVILYWKDLLAVKSKTQHLNITLDRLEISFLDCPIRIALDHLEFRSVTKFIPTLLAFEFENEVHLDGLHILGRDQTALIGSARDLERWKQGELMTSMEGEQDEEDPRDLHVSALVKHDPSLGSLTLRLSLDNMLAFLAPKELLDLLALLDNVKTDLAATAQHDSDTVRNVPSESDAPYRTIAEKKSVTIDAEVLDAFIILPAPEQDSFIEMKLSCVGNMASAFREGTRQLDQGTIHFAVEVTSEHRGTSNDPRELSPPDIGMTMTQSMLLAYDESQDGPSLAAEATARGTLEQSFPLVKPFTFDVSWTIPLQSALHTKQYHASQTSDIQCFFTPEQIRFLRRYAVQSLQLLDALNQRGDQAHEQRTTFDSSLHVFKVVFPKDPLGLKLGPTQQKEGQRDDPSTFCALEVRGYAKQCEEAVSRAVKMGDLISSVNGTSLRGVELEAAKRILREATWPRTLVFVRRRTSQALICDPLQFVPVSQHVWTCKSCGALQPMEARSRPSTLTCSWCGARHRNSGLLDFTSQSDCDTDGLPGSFQHPGAIVAVEAFENQRLYLLVGWSSSMLPGDPSSWTDHTLTQECSLKSLSSLPNCENDELEWRWASGWSIDKRFGDQDGWMYAKSFEAFTENAKQKRRNFAKSSDSVRRRRWVRQRVLVKRYQEDHALEQDIELEQEPRESREDRQELCADSVSDADSISSDVSKRGEKPQSGQEYSSISQPVEEQMFLQQRHIITLDTGGHRLCVTYVDEKRTTPLLRLYVDHGDLATIRQMSSGETSRMACSLACRIDVYNATVLDWEPLVERAPIAIEIQTEKREDQLIESAQNSKSGTTKGQVSSLRGTVLGLDSLNVNLSLASLSMLSMAFRSEEGKSFTEEKTTHSHATLRNRTGLNFFFQAQGADGRGIEVENGEEIALVTLESYYSWHAVQESFSITLFGGWKPLHGLCLTQLGRTAYAIESESLWADSGRMERYARVIVDVQTKANCRVMSIESPVQFHNLANSSIALRLGSTGGGTDALLLGSCEPHESVFLPLVHDIYSHSLHIYLNRQNGERYGSVIDLKHIHAAVKKACMANLARAKSSMVFVERNLSQLSPGVWGVVQVSATVLEQCFSSVRPNDSVQQADHPHQSQLHRLVVGNKFSTFQIRLELISPLKIENQLEIDLEIRVRAKAMTGGEEQQAARLLGPSDSWLVEFVDDPSHFEWSLRSSAINASERGWSAWASFVSIVESNALQDLSVSLASEHGEVILLNASVVEDRLEGISVVRLVLAKTMVMVDHTSLSLQCGVLANNRIAREIPNQSSVRTVVVVENQRWHPLKGWSAPSLPRDPDALAFGTFPGAKQALGSLGEIDPPTGFQWAEPEWVCTQGGAWLYSSDFESADWRPEKRNLDMVRRRTWKRASVSTWKQQRLSTDGEDLALLGCFVEAEDELVFRSSGGPWSKGIPLAQNRADGNHHHFFVDVWHGTVEHPVVVPLLVSQTFSHELHVWNRFELVNQLPDTLFVAECVKDASVLTAPSMEDGYVTKLSGRGERCKLMWRSLNQKKRFIRFGRWIESLGNVYWTGPVDPCILDEFVLFMRRPNDLGRGLLQVRITESDVSKSISVEVSECREPPMYRIENRSLHPIIFGQRCDFTSGLVPIVVRDRRSCAFGWEEMTQSSQPLLAIRQVDMSSERFGSSGAEWNSLFQPGKSVVVDLQNDVGVEAKELPQESSKAQKDRLQVRVYSEGGTRVVCISHAWAIVEAPPLVREPLDFSLRCELGGGLTVSLIGSRRELMCMHVKNGIVAFARSRVLSTFQASIDSLQIDDPNPATQLPVILRPLEQASENGFFSMAATWYGSQDSPLLGGRSRRVQLLSIEMKPFDLRLGRTMVRNVSTFLSTAGRLMKPWGRSQTSHRGDEAGEKVLYYFDLLEIGPLALRLTLSPNDVDSALATKFGGLEEDVGGNRFDTISSPTPTNGRKRVTALSVLTSALSRVVDLNEPDVKLPYWALALEHILRGELRNQRVQVGALEMTHTVLEDLRSNPVTQHYQYALGSELASSVFVTTEMLEKPVNMFRSLSKGLRLGRRSGPTSLSARSLIGGTASLSEGFLRGLARGLATMSMSNEYLLRRRHQEEDLRGRRESLGGVLSHGMGFVRAGFAEGVTGLVTEPYRGIRSGGAVGFLGGIGKGFVGAAVKPMVGVLDAATLASQSAQREKEKQQAAATQVEQTWHFSKATAKVEAKALQGRVRLARPLIGRECKLSCFDHAQAEAACVLQSIEHGRFAAEPFFGSFFFSTASGAQDELYLWTVLHVVSVSSTEEIDKARWVVSLADILSLSVTKVGEDEWGVHLRTAAVSRFLRCGSDTRQAAAVLASLEAACREQEASDCLSLNY